MSKDDCFCPTVTVLTEAGPVVINASDLTKEHVMADGSENPIAKVHREIAEENLNTAPPAPPAPNPTDQDLKPWEKDPA